MRVLAVIPAKSKSKRFPGKNRLLAGKVAKVVVDSGLVDKTVIATDCLSMAVPGCTNFPRTLHEVNLDLPLIEVLKHVYYAQHERYDAILCVFGGSIGVTATTINKAIRQMENNQGLQEVRSFDNKGLENGLILLSENRLLEGHISANIGMIISGMKEIHYKEDLNDIHNS